jgi:hypothetical protein
VTRIGEPSSVEGLFTLGSLFKLQKWPKILSYFSRDKMLQSTEKMVWAAFWAIFFSQTHLVTLVMAKTILWEKLTAGSRRAHPA